MNREEMEKGKPKEKSYYDYTLLFLILFLMCFGIVMIGSISAYNATKYYDDAMLFVKKQLKVVIGGSIVMFIVSQFDYHAYYKRIKLGRFHPSFVQIGFFLSFLLQGAVIFLGDDTNGSNRWLALGSSIKLQPSEISKIALIMLLAYKIQKNPKALDRWVGFIKMAIIPLGMIILVAIENLSTAIVMAGILFICCITASRKKMYYILTMIAGSAFAGLFIWFEPYRRQRLEIWQSIETHPKGYQILQGMYAVSSGGWFGKGLGNSIQKLGYIPEVHTDMIFSCICEELGVVGAICLLSVYVCLIWRIMLIAVNAKDMLGSLIAVGVMTQVGLQVILNVAVVTNSIPSTGVPLPFISYGGSSLLFLLMEMGVLLNVAKQVPYKQ